jgi:hypothetical protein
MSLFDKIFPKNRVKDPKRIIKWVEKSLTIFVNRQANSRFKALKKAPPWNFWYLRADLLQNLGWKWIPKTLPVVSSATPCTTKPLEEQPLKKPEVIPLRDPILGTRVQVLWGHYKKYFIGTIREVDKSRAKSYLVHYDDGDINWEFPTDCERLSPDFDGKSEGCKTCLKKTKLLRCTKCKKVSYCSKQCQSADWKNHKVDCK